MIKYFSQRLPLILIILFILVLGGIFALRELPVDIFPNLNYPLINIITHYPGGAPRDVEVLITRPIENQMSGVMHVRRISSISRQGLSQVSVEFDWGVSVRDARQMVVQALSAVSPNLPEGSIPVIENIGSSLQEIMGFGVIPGDSEINLSQLKYIIRTKIANHLKSIKGVLRIEVVGGENEAFVVSPIPEELMRYGISLTEIKDILNSNNIQVVAGYVEKEYQDYAVRGLGNIKNIEDLKNIVVKRVDGIPVLLKDVANVKSGTLPQRYKVYINGKPGVAFSIFKNQNANTIKVADEVNKKLAEIRRTLPSGISLTRYYDQSELIKETSGNLKSDIFTGGLLVVLILFLFLGRFRDSLLIAFSTPIVVIVSFVFFRMGHLSLNMITLGAMVVAVGMIVDGSIIVLENILRQREMGESALRAAIDGTKEIAGADISGVLTTVAAFIPFLFLTGLGGRFATPFGWVMVITLLLSLIFSLSIIPIWLARDERYKSKPPLAHKAIRGFINFNQKVLSFSLRKRGLVLLVAFLVFVSSVVLLIFSPISFLPKVDEGAILLEYVLPPGTSLNESNRIGKTLERIILKDPDVKTIYRRTGSEAATYQVEPVNRGELVIKLSSRHLRKRGIFDVIKDLRRRTDQIPGLITLYHQVTSEKMDESFSGLPTVFGVTIYGEDYAKLIKYSEEIEQIARSTKGIGGVINNTKYRVPEIRIKPISGQMARYGLSSKEIMEELKLYLGGEITSKVVKREKVIPIFERVEGESLSPHLGDINQIPIMIDNGHYIPLSQLVDVSTYYGANSITHINLRREVTMPLEIEGPVGVIAKRLRSKIKKLGLPEGYFVEFGGQYKSLVDMLKKFLFFAIISILIVYLIMGIQFGNYIHPFAIIFELPISFIGAFLAIAISRQPLNISFFIGLITLVGVSVNNGIVLVDYINRRRRQGMKREKAIAEAARIRARPILLTALTSVLALFPISLGLGVGSKIHQPLAICVMGGLLVNMILTLNVLPAIYCVLEDLFKFKLTKSNGND